MSGIKAKKVAHYVIMPEIIPLFRRLFTSGFGYVAFLMAQIYSMVRLLPTGHAYLNPNNIGQFGIRHVIAEAANNIVISRRNIDQMVIFGALLVGIALLIIQIALIFISFIFGPAFAGPGTPSGTALFVTQFPEQDLAFIMLDQVFGIPEIFNSCVSSAVACEPERPGAPSSTAFPYPFHLALHQLFRFYSTGMMAVGALIFLYFVVVVVAETATTGTPFGQRFQNIWVPIRLVVAIGLLVPINYGLNSSQYITLFGAKIGSSLATNAWRSYMNELEERVGAGYNPTGEVESLLGFPEPPDISPVIQTMSIVHTCAFAHWYTKDGDFSPGPPNDNFRIKPYLDNPSVQQAMTGSTTYDTALTLFDNADIVITFGEEDPDTGNIIPTCGAVRVSVKDITSVGETGGAGASKLGPEAVQEYYFDLIRDLWFNEPQLTAFAGRYSALNTNIENTRSSPCDFGAGGTGITNDAIRCRYEQPDLSWKQGAINTRQGITDARLQEIWVEYTDEMKEKIQFTDEILARGWGGAGIWYNTIARINGAFMDSFINMPQFDRYPAIMEEIRTENRRENNNTATLQQFTPSFANNQSSDVVGSDATIAKILGKTYEYWNQGSVNLATEDGILTSSGLEGTINLIFGTEGLFSMTRNNNHVHPLAQLAMLGKGLVEASIRNVAGATVGSGVGGLFRMIDNTPGALVEAVSGFITSTAFIGLTAGLVLFYILPFLPFVYFFFALGEWVKAIFEAMVGAPLWALAHLRIDGDGLPGTAASNGYFLILEIVIRPILTVFGLVAATLIFTAQLRVLNFTWRLVTDNLAGFKGNSTIGIVSDITIERGVIDNFFFTIIYAIIAYMMAIAAFKLINKIPDNILRWIGASVSSFGDINQDPTDGLTRFAALGGATAGQQLAGGVSQLGGGLGQAVGGAVRRTGGGPAG